MSTPCQIAANQANAQLSTGPRTDAGRAKSSLNAVKTGLTGRTVLLPAEDAAIYQQHIERFSGRFQPVTDAEKALTQSIADAEWRLLRIPTLESGIFAIGHLELADSFSAYPDRQAREAMIAARIFLDYRKQLNNLSLQESRLRRMRDADIAALQALQNDRRQRTESELTLGETHYRQAQKTDRSFNPRDFGFEISLDQIKDRIARADARKAAQETLYAVARAA